MIHILDYNLKDFKIQHSIHIATCANHCKEKSWHETWKLRTLLSYPAVSLLMLLHQSSCFRQENCEQHKSRAHFVFIAGNSRNGKNGLMGFARFTTLSVCLLSPSEDSNTNLESKLVCYQITTHFLCHPCFKTQLRTLCNKPP